MRQPRIRAIDGGFEYAMPRPVGVAWELIQRRANGWNNGYEITATMPQNLDPVAYVLVTIKSSWASRLSAELRKPPLNAVPLDPENEKLKPLTQRVEWVCGYWKYPPDTLM